MNQQTKQLLQKLWDHVDCQQDDGLYPVKNLSLTHEENEILDKLVHTPDEQNKSPWISCAEEPDNGIVKSTEIEAIDTSDTNYRLKDEKPFKILFQISGQGVTWFFDDHERRNEVYTKIYNRLHPEEL